jgi:hypothetical protein
MVTVIVRHEVKDFANWRKEFDADQPNLVKAGVKLIGLYTSIKNPNDVTIIVESPNAELFDVMMSDPQRQEAIKRGGVIGVPVATFLNKV